MQHSTVPMRLAQFDADQIQLPVAHAAFGNERLCKIANALDLALEHHALDALIVIEMGVQVNGKFRGAVLIAIDADEGSARAAALADPKISAHVEGKTVKKVIYVPAKILNFIVG